MSQAVAKLGEEIIEEAKAEAQRRIAKAEEEARKVLEEARAEVERLVEEAKAKAREEAELAERQKLSEVRRRNALRILEEKNRLIREAFQQAYEKLKNLKFESYANSLAKLLEVSIPAMGSDTVEIWLNKRDLDRQSRLLKNLKISEVKVSVAKKPVDTIGGFILTSPDGKIKLDQTFEARLQAAERRIKKEIAKILFG
ncbi:MAG: V-type ATP synthase subunit E [Candidatus Hecatellaceae archaeon]